MRSVLSLSIGRRIMFGAVVAIFTGLGITPWRLEVRQAAACDAPRNAGGESNPQPRQFDPARSRDVTSDWGVSPTDARYTAAHRRTDTTASAQAQDSAAEVARLYRELITIQGEVAQTRQRLLEIQQSNYQRQLDRHTPAGPTPYDVPRSVPSTNAHGTNGEHADISYSFARPGYAGRGPIDQPSRQPAQYAVPDQRDELDALEQDVQRILDQIHEMKTSRGR